MPNPSYRPIDFESDFLSRITLRPRWLTAMGGVIRMVRATGHHVLAAVTQRPRAPAHVHFRFSPTPVYVFFVLHTPTLGRVIELEREF